MFRFEGQISMTIGHPRLLECLPMLQCGLRSALALAIVALLLAPAATAQEAPAAAPAAPTTRYKEQRDRKEPGGGAKIEILKVLGEGQVRNQDQFVAWWRFRVAEFTLPENASQFTELRKKIKQELQRAKDPARTQSIEQILTNVREIIADSQYSPAARVNAILILGDLNKTEPDFKGDGAVPLPAALGDLIKIVDNAVPVNDINDALRAAALIGLERHAAGPMPDDGKKNLSAELREMIATEAPPEGRSVDVHGWLTGRAKGILESLGAGASVAAPAP